MDAPFPMGFPFPTAFYYVFYVVTLVIHVLFMNYVLAGTGYLAVARLLTMRGSARTPSLMMGTLAEWLPFSLSAAITAGVAPLLFMQILYQHAFYTANLLLFHRWMSIVPVLIVGFYLLYLWKSRPAGRWPVFVRALIGLTAFGCFAFTAYSWTENHMLSVQGEDVWSAFYASDAIVYRNEQIAPRLVVWFVGSFPTMVLMVSWQMWYRTRREPELGCGRDVRVAAITAIVALVATAGCGAYYFFGENAALREQVSGDVSGVYLCGAVAGLAIQLVAWIWQLARRAWHGPALFCVSFGLLLSVVGATVAREAVRLAAVDIESLYPSHREAWEVGGLFVFLVFFVINAVAIAGCFVLVKRSRGPVGAP